MPTPERPSITTIEELAKNSEDSSSSSITKKLIFLALWILLLCGAVYVIVFIILPDIQPLTVTTIYGKVKGLRLIRNNKVVYSYLGIPYALPPLGQLRWQRPEPPLNWTGVLHAVHHPLACPQFVPRNSALFKQVPESEDCLYLNVYTPGRRKAKQKKTVMVYFHGGSFLRGKISDYDGATLSAFADVVVVTVAYRLGIFGFMFDNSTDLPGNVGLLDQVQALHWIKENIAVFGGDPEKIVPFGNSAGGISVALHTVSPLSRTLFKRGIMQSGSLLTPVMLYGADTGPIKVEMVANKTGCPFIPRRKQERYATFTNETYNCLRARTTQELLGAQASIVARMKDIGFFPVVDGYFLKEHPFDTLDSNYDFNHTHEVLMGTNANEGALFMSISMPDLFPTSKDIPRNLTLKQINQKLRKYGKKPAKIFEFFNINEDTAAENLTKRFDKVLGEVLFLCPDIYFINAFTQNPGKKAYYYRFLPRTDIVKRFIWAKGAVHSEELQFVFGRPLTHSKDYSPEERELSKVMMTDWAQFAKHGTPRNNSWLPCVNDQRFYMVYGKKESKLESNFPPNNCDAYFESFYTYVKSTYSYYIKR